MKAWYERFEPVFLIDYLQFGNTLRYATLEPHIDRLRAIPHGLLDEEEHLLFVVAVAAQQLGHAYEDLAAMLAALTCRHTPSFNFKGKPKTAAASTSIYWALLNYQGTLTLTDLIGHATAQAVAQRCGFDVLAEADKPRRIDRLRADWLLTGIAHHAVQARASGARFHVPFLKLKHGGIAICEARLISNDVPARHIGVVVPGTDPNEPKVLAVPATRKFTAEAATELDRVRVALNVVVAFYLQRYHPDAWKAGHVTFEQMLDPRVRAEDAVLIGPHLDLGRLVPVATV
jgi:hypothetical protein